MKVLLISPYSGVIGGISKWTKHIISHFEKSDEDLQIELFDFSRAVNGQTISSDIRRVCLAVKEYSCLTYRALRSIIKSDSGVVHICTSASYLLFKDILLVLISRICGKKSVIHFHFGRIPELADGFSLEWILLRFLLIISNIGIVLDSASLEALHNKNINNVRILPNPLSAEVVDIIDSNSGIVRDPYTLVFCGHVIETKGVFELVDACKQIPDIKLKLYGCVSEDMKLKLREHLNGSDDSWMCVLGEQDYETVIKGMLSAGVFVLPTYTEGFPNVILESMACRCPIVATNVGAIPEMLNIYSDNQCGICVKPRDVDELRDAIITMLTSVDMAGKYAENARTRVISMYSMPQVANALVGIWKQI